MVDWIGPTEHVADQLLAQPTEPEDLSALEEAKAAILDLLAAGPLAAEEAMKELKKRGVAERTWKRAKAALRIVSERVGFGRDGKWSWLPPTHSGPQKVTVHPPQKPDSLSDPDPLCPETTPIEGRQPIEGRDFKADGSRPPTALDGDAEGATAPEGVPSPGGRITVL
jgi:hypothetical protein